MNIEGYSIPENLLYTAEHDWLRIENDKKTIIGITDYAAKTLHDIVYVDLPVIDSKVEHLSPFGSIESVKAVSDLYSPITGIISKLNDDLKTNPEIVSQSPYDKGWMLEVVPSSLETESKSLLTPQSYADLIKDLTKK